MSLSVILDKSHWMLYFIVMAMYPRFLITFDEEGNLLPVTVRVGQVSSLSSFMISISLVRVSDNRFLF